jgi:wyosine [tRNA(Phe)-imidazoG37] synthetase (radical SAM superfamily)
MTRPPDRASYRHLFGPVPSRRLGRSLGIDLVPHKVCTLDCRYCECGPTTTLTRERRAWVDPTAVLAELERWLSDHPGGGAAVADHLTFSGAGEPTLHQDLGAVIRWLAPRTAVALALLTNGTLLDDPALRAELSPLAVICPSLDTAVEETFAYLNRPHSSLSAATLVDSLAALRREFSGRIWLEVLLADGVNDSDVELDALAAAIARIQPDRVQLNTAVRPGSDSALRPASEATLARALARLGPRAEAIASFTPRAPVADSAPVPTSDDAPAEAITEQETAQEQAVLAVIRRRPETLENLAASLGMTLQQAQDTATRLEARGDLRAEPRERQHYLIATQRDPEDPEDPE